MCVWGGACGGWVNNLQLSVHGSPLPLLRIYAQGVCQLLNTSRRLPRLNRGEPDKQETLENRDYWRELSLCHITRDVVPQPALKSGCVYGKEGGVNSS